MAIASVIFLFLSQLLVICELVQSHCPKEFECGNIKMWFPFSTHARPDCGLHLVECHHGKPKIDVLPGRDWYIQRQLEDRILVTPSFDQGEDCTAFSDLTLPHSPAISFETHNVTMLRCSLSSPNETLDWNLYQYKNFSGCEKDHYFDIYYNYGDGGISDVAGGHPSSCSIIRWPLGAAHTFDPQVEHQLYDVLYNVFLKWKVPESCTGCQNGKQCIVDRKNNTCSKEKSKKLGLILGIVFSAAACICILFLVITVIRCRKKRINMDPSSKEEAGFSSIYFGASVYSYADLEEATNNFASSRKLGDGGFGIVYYGKLQDGKEVAVKVLHEHNYKRMEQFMNEIRILTSLRHPNLVYLYGCTSKRSQELLLVYEYVPNGTVSDHLHGYKSNTTSLSCRRRIDIALQTATALAYLHKSDIIHRDVKTNNILLDHKFHVKVADFGLSRLFPIDVTHVSTAPQGTPGYVDPEYHECYQLTDKSDVYSFGVVLVELMSSLPAVDLSRNRHEINLANLAMRRIQSNEIDELIDPSLGYRSDPEVYRTMSSVAELAFRCLQYEKEMRPGMDEVVEVLKVISDFKDNSELKKTSKANDDMQAETKQT